MEAEQNKNKDRKAFSKLMNNTIYRKKMETLRNRINLKVVNNEKNYLKLYIKTKLYGAQSIWQ